VSPSPDRPARSSRYENGWIAINRLIREGEGWSGHERNVLYWNNGNGTFSDVSGASGLDFPEDGRAFAAFDFDQDGDLDIILKNRNTPQLRLLRNDLPRHSHSIAFRLQGVASNRDAVGARLVLETDGGRRLTKTVRSGSGFLSQPTRTVYFGLGSEASVRSLTVFWPSGEVQRLGAFDADHLIQIRENQPPAAPAPFDPGRSQPAGPRPSSSPPSSISPGIWLTEPLPAPRFDLRALDRARPLESYRGRRLLLNFWATWCAPCAAELADFQKHAKELRARGLETLLIAVDGLGEEAKVRQYLRDKGLGFPTLLATEEAVRGYSLILRHLLDQASDLVVPATFLLNESGEIIKLYVGRTSAEQILSDLDRWPANRAELLQLALPFPGRAYATEFRRNWVQLSGAFALAELWGPAEAYLNHAIQSQPDFAEAFDQLGLVFAHQKRWPEALEAHQRAAVLGLSSPAVHTHLAAALAHLERLADAASAAARAIAEGPQDPEALRVWASIQSRLGKTEESLRALQSSLQLDPDHADGHFNLGLLFRRMARLPEATAAFRRAVSLDPAHAEALNNLGVISAEDGSLDQALDYFHRALKARPEFASAHRNLGLVYVRQGDLSRAEESFRNALRISPRYAEALNDLGGVYLKTQRLREALPLFEQARREDPKFAQAYLNAARVYLALGETGNARSFLEALLKVQPKHPTATEWLRRLDRKNQ